MFGGLHIEIAALKLLGDLLRDSGWVSTLTDAEIASSGVAESFLSVSNVARTRQAHQVRASSLFEILKTAYENQSDKEESSDVSVSSILTWCSSREKEIPQFRFCGSILNLELLVLCFVRSYRESDFKLYMESLSVLIPYFFALDHMNYARWLPIYLRDMVALETLHPIIYSETSLSEKLRTLFLI